MRLLILSCSATKRTDSELLPAGQRYNGVAFGVLRKAVRELAEDRHPRVRIRSAEFGLIAADTPIPWYDRQMEPARAAELQPQIQAALRAALTPDVDVIFIALSRAYLPALGDIPAGPWTITYAQGGIGQRLGQLRRWLYEEE
jgi:hypothetical protein